MLNTPTSVDSLPRLRRFTSSQTQLSSFAYLGHDEGKHGESKNQEAKENKENTKNKEEIVAKKGAGTPPPPAKEAKESDRDEQQEERGEAAVQHSRTSEVLCQPVSDIQGTAGSRVKGDPQDRRDLVEVSLSGPKPQSGRGQETAGEGETGGEDQKMCCGFFFQVNTSTNVFFTSIRPAVIYVFGKINNNFLLILK